MCPCGQIVEVEWEKKTMKRRATTCPACGQPVKSRIKVPCDCGEWVTLEKNVEADKYETKECPSCHGKVEAGGLLGLSGWTHWHCPQCGWINVDPGPCDRCNAQTKPLDIYNRFCIERVALIGVGFLVGIAIWIGTGDWPWIFVGLVIPALLKSWHYLSGREAQRPASSILEEEFTSDQLRPWMYEKFSWRRFCKEPIVILAILGAFFLAAAVLKLAGN